MFASAWFISNISLFIFVLYHDLIQILVHTKWEDILLEPRIYKKQSTYLHKIGLRCVHTTPPRLRSSLGMLLSNEKIIFFFWKKKILSLVKFWTYYLWFCVEKSIKGRIRRKCEQTQNHKSELLQSCSQFRACSIHHLNSRKFSDN